MSRSKRSTPPWRVTPGGRTGNSLLTTDPAVCSFARGYFLVVALNSAPGTSLDKFYSMAGRVPQVDPELMTAWKKIGSVRQFTSSPSCTFENPFRYAAPPPTNVTQYFVIAGKGTDNKIYTLRGHQDPVAGGALPDPAWDGGWTAVGTNTYSGNYGRPAVVSNGSKLALTFLSSDQVIHAVTQSTPYTTTGWSTIKNGPVLTGVTVDGIPAIIYVRGSASSPVNKFVIMVRGVAADGTGGLYWIYFDGSNFVGSWSQAFVPYPVVSDPAMEYDDQSNALTVYFKTDGDTILQTSVPTPDMIGVYPFDSVGLQNPNSYPQTVNAPRVVFGPTADTVPSGIRMVVTRGTNPQTPPAEINSTILFVSDHHFTPYPPYTAEELPVTGANCGNASDVVQQFNNNMVGCSNNVNGFSSQLWTARSCGVGSHVCSAAEWLANRGSSVPTHHYWTNDNLRYNGSASNACFVSQTVGSLCAQDTPMRVCAPTHVGSKNTDSEGNECNLVNCGYNSNAPIQYFGGCSGNFTAGTLCCLDVQ